MVSLHLRPYHLAGKLVTDNRPAPSRLASPSESELGASALHLILSPSLPCRVPSQAVGNTSLARNSPFSKISVSSNGAGFSTHPPSKNRQTSCHISKKLGSSTCTGRNSEAEEQNGQDAKKCYGGHFLHTTDRKSLLAVQWAPEAESVRFHGRRAVTKVHRESNTGSRVAGAGLNCSITNPQQVFPLAIVALEPDALGDLERRDQTSFDLLAASLPE